MGNFMRVCRALAACGLVTASAGADDVLTPPPFEEFLVLPLRVHVLTSAEVPAVDCRLKDADVARVVGKANGIWNKAGLHWGLESVVREPAARQAGFLEALDLRGPGDLAVWRTLRPDASRTFDGLHIYYVHEFPVNGVYLGPGYAFVQETATLRPVPGGIDEPVPRVTAHELGHALGLPHRQARTNLLASGTNGTLLNAEEVATARKNALEVKGVKTVAQLEGEALRAEKDGRRDAARTAWTWLGQIPGAGGEPKARLERLDPGAGAAQGAGEGKAPAR